MAASLFPVSVGHSISVCDIATAVSASNQLKACPADIVIPELTPLVWPQPTVHIPAGHRYDWSRSPSKRFTIATSAAIVSFVTITSIHLALLLKHSAKEP